MAETIIVQDAAQLAEPRLQRLFNYWNEKRGKRPAPARREIDPVEIPDILGFLNLYNVQREPRDYVVRLNGSDVAAMMRRDITGKSLGGVLTGEDGKRCSEAFSICVDQAKPTCFETSLDFCGNDFAVQTILALPLTAGGESVDMIISAHAFRLKDYGNLSEDLVRGAVWGE